MSILKNFYKRKNGMSIKIGKTNMAARYPLSIRFKEPKIKISISNRTEVT